MPLYRPSRREVASIAVLVVAALSVAFLPLGHGHGAPGIALLLLLATGMLVQGWPFHFSDRGDVTLILWPAALLWYYGGPFVAVVGIGAAVVAVSMLLRRPTPVVTLAVALVSILVAHLGAGVVQHIPRGLEAIIATRLDRGQQAITVFCVVFAVSAPLLGRLVADDNPRPEFATSLIVAPFAVLFIGVVERHGHGVLPLLILAFDAVLLFAQSAISTATLHQYVAALTHQAEEMARALAAERATTTALMHSFGDGIFTVDQDLRITHASPALAALTGRSEEDMVGRAVDEVLGPRHAAATVQEALRRALQDGHAVCVDSGLQLPEGARDLMTSYSALADSDGNVMRGVGVVRDVTGEHAEVRPRGDYLALVTPDMKPR